MTRHLLRLIWNRRRGYVLLALELLVSFLILVTIGANGWYWLSESRRSPGFDYQDVWSVYLRRPELAGWGDWTPTDSAAVQQVYQDLASLPAVAAAAEAGCGPFSGSCSNWTEVDGRTLDYYHSFVSDSFVRVLSVDLVAGRWFGPEDDGSDVEPVVVTAGMARILFGEADPVGREFPLSKEGLPGRVVGVVSHWRPFLDMEEPAHFVFHRVRLQRPVTDPSLRGGGSRYTIQKGLAGAGPPTSFVLRLQPGVPRRFEQEAVGLVRQLAPGWRVELAPLAEIREENFRARARPLITFGVISAFLLLMVCLGLTGVLWQSVTQRTREIGVRRAAGASAVRVCGQLIGEMLLLTTCAVAIGAVLVLHVAALHLTLYLTPGDYLVGLIAAAVVLYLLVAAASLYPGWLATRVHPAEALHYE
ncbi:MAG: FtsX-like permease family protein [Candidatus Latescibacterota bacterium]|jgi:putative ABC transport system permease protein